MPRLSLPFCSSHTYRLLRWSLLLYFLNEILYVYSNLLYKTKIIIDSTCKALVSIQHFSSHLIKLRSFLQITSLNISSIDLDLIQSKSAEIVKAVNDLKLKAKINLENYVSTIGLTSFIYDLVRKPNILTDLESFENDVKLMEIAFMTKTIEEQEKTNQDELLEIREKLFECISFFDDFRTNGNKEALEPLKIKLTLGLGKITQLSEKKSEEVQVIGNICDEVKLKATSSELHRIGLVKKDDTVKSSKEYSISPLEIMKGEREFAPLMQTFLEELHSVKGRSLEDILENEDDN